MSDLDWRQHAACVGTRDTMFPAGAAQHAVKAVCVHCPVRTECLAEALDTRTAVGVWGGTTERERRALLKRRPNVTSWAALLQAARAEYDQAHTAA